MNKTKITAVIDIDDEFLHDIITNTVESAAINYWAELKNYIVDSNGQTPSVLIREDEEGAFEEELGEWVTVDKDFIIKGIEKIVNNKFQVSDSIHKEILTGVYNNDGSYIDIECCDCIIQAAMFGELVYG